MSVSEFEENNEGTQQPKEEINPFDEALFIKLDGDYGSKSPFRKVRSPDKVDLDDEKVPPLVQLDLRFDLLRAFLEQMQKAVNQHAEIINNVQKEVKYRCTESSMADYLERIASGLHKDCGERSYNLRLNDDLANKHHQTEESPNFKRAVDKLMGKMEVVSAHLLKTIKNQSKTDKRLTKIEKEIVQIQSDHISKSDFDSEKRRMQSELFDYLNDNLDKFKNTLEDHAQDLENKKNQCDNAIKENETKTLWKIKDCEELLQKRVSETFVNDSISLLESKLSNKIDKGHKRAISQALLKAEEKVDNKMANFEKLTQQEFNSYKRTLAYHDNEISKRITTGDLKPVNDSIKEVRNGFEKEMESMMEHINKFSEYGRRIASIESLTKNISGPVLQDGSSVNGKGEGATSEYNAELSIKNKMVDDKLKNLTAACDALKSDLENKAEVSEMIKIENTKVSKDELLALLPSEESKDVLKEEFKNEIAYFHKSIDELARAWDLKLVKLRKEIDLFTIKKEIGKRALIEEVKHDFHVIQAKCSKVEHLVSNFSFEIDGFKDFIKRVSKNISELQDVNRDVLVGNKNVNCLSCGRGDKKFIPTMPLIKGQDGRGVYKGSVTKGYNTRLDRSITDAEILDNKFFTNRRENSPPKVNQSHTQSRKKFSKPSSGLPRRRCTTALSRKSNSQTGVRRNYKNPSESQNMDDSNVYKDANTYEQVS
ncbi:unnamed protein product [Moneuplotes crassus]|uniref:Uncharacterized protein n=1 Tax=Euplotes crassus TaxID=5936 RepID=A0AAD1Y9N1_EUPCR|nr:unnamed protein product [Moneuplotes crassus]